MLKRALVVTTINAPNRGLIELARGAASHGLPFYVLGDTKSPATFDLPGARFVPIAEQEALFPEFCRLLPRKHYTRKNVGYLLALQAGAREIQETDDDNIPRAGFWESLPPETAVDRVDGIDGWFNVYSLFSKEPIWPRGFPLEEIHRNPTYTLQPDRAGAALIQQGLADENPDVDAVFRLTRKLPFDFDQRRPVLLGRGVYTPFNSQNTVFAEAALPLLYLPSHCSFRMTDIWRSFVAQRCLWELGSGVLFHAATVFQERNEHSLLRDFEEEIPGYLLNEKIRRALEELALDSRDTMSNLLRCYEKLVQEKLLPEAEWPLVNSWSRNFAAVLYDAAG
jgi:hypothetical protein